MGSCSWTSLVLPSLSAARSSWIDTKVRESFHDAVTVCGQQMHIWGKIFQKAVYFLSQHPLCGTVCPIAGIHQVQESRDGSGHSTSHYLLWLTSKTFVSGFYSLVLCWPRSFGAKAGKHTSEASKLQAKIPPWSFWCLHALSKHAKKRVRVLAGVTDPIHHGNTWLLLHNGGKKRGYVEHRTPFGHLLVEQEQLNPGRMTNGLEL